MKNLLNTLFKFCVLIICFLVTESFIQAQNDWNGLTPLKSTKADAEKLLGKQTNVSVEGFGSYENGQERVYIWYASGRCENSDGAQWNVPKDSITRITIDPSKKLLISSLKLDLTKFEKVIVPPITNKAFYISEDKSQEIEVFIDENGNEQIDLITFLPGRSKADLRCGNHKSS
jgi:hypothetical protein